MFLQVPGLMKRIKSDEKNQIFKLAVILSRSLLKNGDVTEKEQVFKIFKIKCHDENNNFKNLSWQILSKYFKTKNLSKPFLVKSPLFNMIMANYSIKSVLNSERVMCLYYSIWKLTKSAPLIPLLLSIHFM